MKKNPFDRSMFESQAGNKDTTFMLVLAGAFLLICILYLIRSYLRSRRGGLDPDDVGDQDLAVGHRGILSDVVTLVAGKRPAREMALSRLVEFDPPSVNCTIIRAGDGREVNEDAGRAVLFHLDGEMFVQDRSFFITTPDGIKAEDRALFTGEGEVINLWFLHDRLPYTVNCEVVERVRFPVEMVRNLDPKVGVGYRLIPLTTVTKRDKRQAIRFSHKPGRGALRVYPQILFDVTVQKTDFRFPVRGSIPPRITALKGFPYRASQGADETDFSAERVVSAFKDAVRMNHTEDRRVYVSKPYMDERTNRRTLIELGYTEVLGLSAQEAGRTIHLKKPAQSVMVRRNRRDPHYLNEGDLIALDYASRSPLDGQNEYFELVCQVIKGGIENITVRPRRNIRQDMNLPIEVLDFSVNGFRFENSREFMSYVFSEEGAPATVDRQKEVLEGVGFVFTFYPRLRFTRDTEAYRPDLPLKFSILGKIVRSEVEKEEEAEVAGRLKAFGVRFMYNPAEYSVDDFCRDRWVMIRPFKENPYFKEVHKSLNGLIAHLESQSRDFLEPRHPPGVAPEKEVVA